jgi:hypothetical protein
MKDKYALEYHQHDQYAYKNHGHPIRTFLMIILILSCMGYDNHFKETDKQIKELQEKIEKLEVELRAHKHN